MVGELQPPVQQEMGAAPGPFPAPKPPTLLPPPPISSPSAKRPSTRLSPPATAPAPAPAPVTSASHEPAPATATSPESAQASEVVALPSSPSNFVPPTVTADEIDLTATPDTLAAPPPAPTPDLALQTTLADPSFVGKVEMKNDNDDDDEDDDEVEKERHETTINSYFFKLVLIKFTRYLFASTYFSLQ